MILDASSGNRTMWRYKTSENIIYMDMETKLQVKPDIFCSSHHTAFREQTFDTIFYDPPHTWGNYTHWHSYPYASKEYLDKYDDHSIPRYYGWDKYAKRGHLVGHIYKAVLEFRRILKHGGLLWLKWNEMSIPLSNILGIINTWRVLLRLYVHAPSQTAGKHQTYWICLEKKKGEAQQTLLL